MGFELPSDQRRLTGVEPRAAAFGRPRREDPPFFAEREVQPAVEAGAGLPLLVEHFLGDVLVTPGAHLVPEGHRLVVELDQAKSMVPSQLGVGP